MWFYTLKIKNKNKKSYVNKHVITNIRMENILKEDLFWLFFLQKDYFDLKLFNETKFEGNKEKLRIFFFKYKNKI